MNPTSTSPLGGQLWKPGAQAPSVVGGRVFTPAASYPSSSDPKKHYTVCEVNDGTTSCDCMGWTRRNPPGGRTCKHTQDYEQYLRPLWNQMKSGSNVQPTVEWIPKRLEAERKEPQERGGTLDQLFKKLDKGGL